MTKNTPQAVQPVTANSTGGQEPARTASPAGHFSHSNAASTHGAASAGGGVISPQPTQAPAPAHPEIEDDGFVTVYPPLNQRHGATNIGE